MNEVEQFWRDVQKRFENEREEPHRHQQANDTDAGMEIVEVQAKGFPDYYVYRSIRHRESVSEWDQDQDQDWGIYILSAGLDDVKSIFEDAQPGLAESGTLARAFLAVCGESHYRVDLYTMLCEGMLGRPLYVRFRRESERSGAVQFEQAYVAHRARAWAQTHGLGDAVETVLRKWTRDDRCWHFDARRLGAYLSTALIDGYDSVFDALRYDQADWALMIPQRFEGKCPVTVLASNSLPTAANPMPMTDTDWFRRWGIMRYEQVAPDTWDIDESVRVIGETFPNGEFPVRIRTVRGDFNCIDTNIKALQATLPWAVDGNVNLSGSRQISLKWVRATDGWPREPKQRINGTLRVTVTHAELFDGSLGLCQMDGPQHVFATNPEDHSIEVDPTKVPRKWADVLNRHLTGLAKEKCLVEAMDEFLGTGLSGAARL